MRKLFNPHNASHWRQLIQWLFFSWCLFLGIQFGLFVRHFESNGMSGYYPRPPGVEGFLPIGSLMSLKTWLRDRPWIWIVLLLALLMAGSIATLVIAELNRPEVLPRG